MSDLAEPNVAETRRMDLRQWPVLLIGLLLIAAAFFLPQPSWRQAALAAGVAAATGAFLLGMPRRAAARRRRAALDTLQNLFGADAAPVVITDSKGAPVWHNTVASHHFGAFDVDSVTGGLGMLFAAPEAALNRLQERAATMGMASDDRVTRNAHIRLSVFRAEGGVFLWRLETVSPRGRVAGALELGLPVAVVDAEDRIVATNSALRKIVGTDCATIDDLISDPPMQPGRIHLVRGVAGLDRFRILDIEGDGGRRELYFLPPDFHGVSDPEQLFDTLPVPLLKLSGDGHVLLSNRGARELLGLDIPRGTRLSDLLSGLGRSVRDWIEEAAAGRGTGRSEFLQIAAGETDRFVQVGLKRIEEDGEARLLAVLNDATELKTLEAQFVQSQKMQAIGQLAGGVAHDFNNLLTAISGHCDLLLLRHDQGDPEYGDLVQIHQNANRAASLVGQLLAFSRKQTLQPETVDIRDTLSDLTHLLNRLVGERVRLFLRHGDGLPPIRVDKRQLEQVIMNLVVNARDAMPEGGEITIATEAVTLETEMRRSRAVVSPGEYVVIRVRDEGMGIAPEKLQKIFEPFFTTKKTGEGTGLGLSTAYGIIKQTGGFIFADSTPGEGAEFTLYLPAQIGGVEADTGQTDPKAVRAPRDGVVLLVEDEAPVRAFASRALNLQGLTVIEAENAEQALSKLEDPELKVDVFVTDVVMPGMDGPSWVQIALKDRPDTRVVFVSGYAEDALSDHKVDIPNSVFLPKPFSLQELTATVQAQLT
ncbi:MAG: ATP-binding protein [Qingshengfaniella sp.]